VTKPHTRSSYQDGHVRVEFCKVCGAEGLELLDDCPRKIITIEQKKMAAHLNLHPTLTSSWPMREIDRLIYVKEKEGDKRLFEEIRKFLSNRP